MVVADIDESGVAPVSTVSVEAEPRIVLYGADGTPWTRPIGFTR